MLNKIRYNVKLISKVTIPTIIEISIDTIPVVIYNNSSCMRADEFHMYERIIGCILLETINLWEQLFL